MQGQAGEMRAFSALCEGAESKGSTESTTATFPARLTALGTEQTVSARWPGSPQRGHRGSSLERSRKELWIRVYVEGRTPTVDAEDQEKERCF